MQEVRDLEAECLIQHKIIAYILYIMHDLCERRYGSFNIPHFGLMMRGHPGLVEGTRAQRRQCCCPGKPEASTKANGLVREIHYGQERNLARSYRGR